MKKIILLCIIFFSLLHSLCSATTPGQLAFVRNGDVWVIGINGSNEKRLTFSGNNRNPAISPDGKISVFSSGYDENTGFGRLSIMTSQC